jgi:hypothetical protein
MVDTKTEPTCPKLHSENTNKKVVIVTTTNKTTNTVSFVNSNWFYKKSQIIVIKLTIHNAKACQ